MAHSVALHPLLDKGLENGSPSFAGGVLVCACTDKPVEVKVEGGIAHNHACGCTKCWKPAGAAFSIVAVAPSDKVKVEKNGDKLKVVDPSALIQRHACTACGVHMHGPVEATTPSRASASSIRNGSGSMAGPSRASPPSSRPPSRAASIPRRWTASGPISGRSGLSLTIACRRRSWITWPPGLRRRVGS